MGQAEVAITEDDAMRDKERRIEMLEKHIEKAEKGAEYSIVRFDLLVISLSTGALLLSINYAKDLTGYSHVGYLKFSWLMLGICIIGNLTSQVTGYYTNLKDISVTKNMVRQKRGKAFKGNQERLKRMCKLYSKTTLILNLVSLMTFAIGLIALGIYFKTNT
ncbi:hypothetical protein J7E50_12110 [Pedobacter sp. ISL-68]|uniref:hypothetical protein n=1 Tax=unclassified Pedobacter TaxID=2628915 RepID=UPI001BEC7CE8|nr:MULTISPECIES: hypothetical protein [unclassified Pedobacter]MBT2561579.1 hypothetical protein [Pedobacter sp. ISL-64]MBT2590968.1 hypothetical protein [Pedobacter sp. ISL-68]